MESVRLKIRGQYNEMSKAEKKISDFVLSDAKNCLEMTAVDIAGKSGVSSASVIRYVQKLGFDGLEGFKLALAAADAQNDKEDMVDPIISKEDDLDTLCRKMDALVDAAFQDFFYQLNKDALKKAINKIKKARRIYLVGIGSSSLPAYDLFHKLKRADFNANFYQDINMMVEFFNYIDKRDVVIAFSYSGQSQEVLYACGIAEKQEASIIAVTRRRDSPLQDIADICLHVPDNEKVMRIGAFTSLHTSIMMADLLYMGVIQENLEHYEVELIKTRKMVEGLKIKK
ncbi:MAG: MurR/RpiR family transcriptional regulator [Hungatella sp.]|jgi:DNA-binding MurR/RpiR family transcriptional regulator|nr:MurR/RpiR family transcriptional regulator [Hungatella sp.]